ncbi:anti-sigma factor family protein [Herminiimonas fonticola]|uniref:Anti-sigma factor RsiW n=1 Tax=Herminiimonas fonticola TaxID=303380 RepID=A0A4R6GI78_9BURK|nr:anti-sigma factor [Herminiimonas fonticola]RBA24731.1 putative transmembrane transcriptional regulator (anti-sigma factor) [Herminiimonas fonticola]TDN93845.1 anti-sigma factor RsiW [Herminiimonas fonticola]
MNQLAVTESDLHAYVDGLLSDARSEEVAAYLAARPEELARMAAYREQNEGLRALFNPVLDEAVPSRLRTGLEDRASSFSLAPSYLRFAAGLLIAIVSGAGGWMLHGSAQTGSLAGSTIKNSDAHIALTGFARQAAIAHGVYTPDVRHPVEIGADQEDQLVTWLSKRTGADMHPPKLGKLGYELVGGRLLPGESGSPVAQFMYQEAGGQRLTLYVSTDQAQNKDTGFRFAQQGAVNVFYWIDGKFGYALSGGVNKAELAKIAHVVYEQLETKPQ